MQKKLRVPEHGFGDDLEMGIRRFLFPMESSGSSRASQMRMDVTESKADYIVKADLPGANREDIHVRIDGNIVQIEVEIRQEPDAENPNERVLRSERHYGCVSRTFSLGHDIDEEKAAGRFTNGVLRLKLPKKATAPCHTLVIH